MQSTVSNAMSEKDKDKEMHQYIIKNYKIYNQSVKNQPDIEKIRMTAYEISKCLQKVMSVLYNDNSIYKTHISNKKIKDFEGNNVNDIRKNMTLIYIYRHELHLLQLKHTQQNGGFLRQLRYNSRYRNLKTKDNNTILRNYDDILKNMTPDNTKSQYSFLNELLKVKNIREIYYIITKLIDEIKNTNDVYIYCAKLIISLYIFQFNLYSKYEKKHTDGNFLNKIDTNTIQNYEYTDKILYDKINEKKPATEVQQPSSTTSSFMYPIINTSIRNISEQQLMHLPSSVSHSSSLHSYSRQSQQPSSTQSSNLQGYSSTHSTSLLGSTISRTPYYNSQTTVQPHYSSQLRGEATLNSNPQTPSLQSTASSTSSLRSTKSQQPSSTQSSYTTSKLSADSSNTLSADSSNTLSTYKYNTIEAQPIKNRIQTPRVLQVKPSPQTSTQQEQQLYSSQQEKQPLYSSRMREPAKLQDGGKRKSKKIFK
jgi:hypothetical protein